MEARGERLQRSQTREDKNENHQSPTNAWPKQRGVKALIVGPAGVGKTSLCARSIPQRTLFLTPKRAISRYRTCRSILFGVDDWAQRAISHVASAAPIRPILQPRVTRRHTTMRSAARWRTSTSTRCFHRHDHCREQAVVPLGRAAAGGVHASAAARKTCAPPMGCTPAKCWPG